MVRCLVEVVGGAGEKGALVMVLLAPDVAFHPPRPRHAHSVHECPFTLVNKTCVSLSRFLLIYYHSLVYFQS